MQLNYGLQALGGHMGTYTTNYNLFMPSVGEQGWGDLVNGNFSTIDTTMAGLDTRLTTCESTDVAYNTRLETLEAGEFESVTAESLYGRLYVPAEVIGTKEDGVPYAVVEAYSTTFRATGTNTVSMTPFTITDYTYVDFPIRLTHGIYVKSSSDATSPQNMPRTMTITLDSSNNAQVWGKVYVNGVTVLNATVKSDVKTVTCSVCPGDTVTANGRCDLSTTTAVITFSVEAKTYYIRGE